MAFVWKEKKDRFKGEGIYHLTFAVVNRVGLLGKLRKVDERSNSKHIATVDYSELGIAVSREFSNLVSKFPKLQILAMQVMPDHFHVVVWAHEGFESSIKMVARGFAQGCSKIARRKYAERMVRKRGASMGRSGVAQLNCANLDRNAIDNNLVENNAVEDNALEIKDGYGYECGNGANTLFSTPYIRSMVHKGQLDKMIKYVHANPDNAWMRKINPEAYVIRRCVSYAGLMFDTMGKARLMDWPEKQVIALSRSLSEEEIAQEVQKALANAERGAITYTVAINKGEKTVARAVRNAGYPLVVLLLDGFPKEGTEQVRYYHPSGVYHEACGKGQLFLLAPLPSCYENEMLIALTEEELEKKTVKKGFHYTPLPHESKRWRMIAANMMLKMLSEM